jgi:exo-1,4-beta-D-glucosaminidase
MTNLRYRNLTDKISVLLFVTYSLTAAATIQLTGNWRMQSSASVAGTAAEISSLNYQASTWYPVTVPSTVLAGLAANKVYPDLYFGKNLSAVNSAAFNVSWWYRTTFVPPPHGATDRIWLDCNGINHRANIWINGRQVAASTTVFGCFRTFTFDITDFCSAGTADNVLAIETIRPTSSDLSINYVDWAPAPPDGNMGIYRDVTVRTTGPIRIANPVVTTKFDLPSLATAHLTVAADLSNPTGANVQATVRGTIGAISFSQTVAVPANQTVEAVFSSDNFQQLSISNPKIWWPWQYGEQSMYDLQLTAEVQGALSDSSASRFGIRQVESVKSAEGYTVFKINGKRILIRGAGWCPDLLQRYTPESQENHLRYIRHLNLNAIRLEGKFEDRRFYDLCDEYGIMVMAGWCCCDKWEQSPTWASTDQTNAFESLRSKIRELRSHPSSLAWLSGSDNPPTATIAAQYAVILSQLRWPNPVLSSASEAQNSGVKMRGPYEWVPPNYWLTDVAKGGAFGFSTEIGPGPAVPPTPSLQKMLPADHLWPIDDFWNYHCGGNDFNSVTKFTNAITGRYGAATSLVDYSRKAQAAAYESHRAMFEAYGRNKYWATGVIQWMLNNAWPSMIWHLYDYYMRPGGSYFGARLACEPLHIQYSYDSKSVAVVNSSLSGYSNLKAIADVYNLDGTAKYHNEAIVSISPDSVVTTFTLPSIAGLSTTYFLRLTLRDSDGATRSINSYWLSTVPDVLNFNAAEWYYTPVSSYGDLKGLQTLATVNLQGLSSLKPGQNGEDTMSVTLKNPTSTVAFNVHGSITKGPGGEELLPILWSDNYFMLLPGEERIITARYFTRDLGGAIPSVVVDGWNVNGLSVPLGVRRFTAPEYGLTTATSYEIALFDCRGRMVWSTKGKGLLDEKTIRFDRFFPFFQSKRPSPGVYLLQITEINNKETNVRNKRLMIVK